jgi:C4-dicarboxylate-binding protein DctP
MPDFLVSRRHWLSTLVGSSGLALPVFGRSKPDITLRFSHVVAQETPKGLAANRFKNLVEERSQGRISVQVFPNAQLYGDHDEMQALQLGAIDIIAPSLSKFGRIGFPEFEMFDLPFLFNQISDVRRITQGPLGQQLLNGLRKYGLVGLGFFDNGFKQMSANRPLLAPEDFAGLRMRVQASQVIAAQMRALGAQPVTLAFSETRLALANGVVDGTENPVSNFWTQHMHEVQRDLSLTDHAYLGYAVVSNQRLWQSLAGADRALLSQALQEALVYGNAIADSQNDSALQALRATGKTHVHVISDTQRARLAEAVKPVHTALTKRIGLHWMQSLADALKYHSS